MNRWRIRLTGIAPQPRKKRDTPKTRYFAHLRSGSSERGATRMVADSYGLPVYQDGPNGIDVSKPINWSLKEIEHLLWLRWMAAERRMGGPNG